MIRFILVCIVVIAYLVLTIPVLLVEWIIGKFSPMTKDISSLRMVQAIFKFILWITAPKSPSSAKKTFQRIRLFSM